MRIFDKKHTNFGRNKSANLCLYGVVIVLVCGVGGCLFFCGGYRRFVVVGCVLFWVVLLYVVVCIFLLLESRVLFCV